MSQRQRVSIIVLGVVVGFVTGLILKDTYNCLITGVIVASTITIMLDQQVKKANNK